MNSWVFQILRLPPAVVIHIVTLDLNLWLHRLAPRDRHSLHLWLSLFHAI
jgi:hypothetical protein